MCLIGVGKLLGTCLEAAELLAAEGIEATVWDPRVVAPLDPAMLADAAGFAHVITAEDGLRAGGIGEAIADALAHRPADAGRRDPAPAVTVLGVPTEYVPHGDPDTILAGFGLDAAGIAATARTALAR